MKTLRTAAFAGGACLLVGVLSANLSPSAVHPATAFQGTVWQLQFDQAADGDGGYHTIKYKLNEGTEGEFKYNVPKNYTKQQKADKLASEFNGQTDSLYGEPTSDAVCKVEVEDNWSPDTDIEEITFIDEGTGEKLHRLDDDPPPVLFPVRISIDITLLDGFDQGVGYYDGGPAEAEIGIGDGPLASVPTTGLTGDQIEQDLLNEFNTLYAGTSWIATFTAGRIVIEDIPCPTGVLFGTSDNALRYALTMTKMGAHEIERYGCGVNPDASLVTLEGLPRIGTTLTLGVDNPVGTQNPGALPLLAISVYPPAAYPCGYMIPGWGMSSFLGELLIGGAPYVPMPTGPPWQGAGKPAPIDMPIPNKPGLVGIVLYTQGGLVDPLGPKTIGLAGAMKLTIG